LILRGIQNEECALSAELRDATPLVRVRPAFLGLAAKRKAKGMTFITPFVALLRSPGGDNPQHPSEGGRRPFRIRYTQHGARTTAVEAATGSSIVGLRIHPDPNHRSEFSGLLSQIEVKFHLRQVHTELMRVMK